MYHTLRKLIAWRRTSWGRAGAVPARSRARPGLEALEVRVVPAAGDWAMYNYDALDTRNNTAETTLSPSNVGGLHVIWNFPTTGVVTGTPAVVNNVVYAGDTSGAFYAVNPDGTLKWQTQLAGAVTASALVTNGVVVIGTQAGGFIYGLDANTGAVRWRIHPDDTSDIPQVWGSGTLVGNNVAIGISSGEEFAATPPHSRGSLVLLDPNTGRVIWQTYTITDAQFAAGSSGATIWCTPAYDAASNTIYAGTGNNYSEPTTLTSDAMIAFDATDGHIKWVNQRTAADDWHPVFHSAEPDYDFGDSPHIYNLADGTKVVGSGQKSGFYHVFNAATGAAINQIQVSGGSTLGGLFPAAAVDHGVVFANDRDPHPGQPATGHLFAIAGDASRVIWQFDTSSPAQSGVAVANGVVYFQALSDRTLYALNEATGALLAQVFTRGGDSGPAISNGRVYLGQGDIFVTGFSGHGGIVALGIDDGPAPLAAAEASAAAAGPQQADSPAAGANAAVAPAADPLAPLQAAPPPAGAKGSDLGNVQVSLAAAAGAVGGGAGTGAVGQPDPPAAAPGQLLDATAGGQGGAPGTSAGAGANGAVPLDFASQGRSDVGTDDAFWNQYS